jgi:hypothetical protein
MPFERNGFSLIEKRHVADRETACCYQRNGFMQFLFCNSDFTNTKIVTAFLIHTLRYPIAMLEILNTGVGWQRKNTTFLNIPFQQNSLFLRVILN